MHKTSNICDTINKNLDIDMINTIKRWYPNILDIITEYEVDKKYVVYGKSQVAFMQNHAKLLRIVNDPLNFVRQMRKERRDQYYGL